jgi:PAS domain S-box-containing protein
VVHAADTSIIMSNPRASDLLGISNDQMIGKTAIDPEWKFIDIENKPMLVDEYPVQRILNTKQAIRDQILGIQQSVKSDIVWVKVNGFPVLNSLDEITEIVISFNDITERKKAEALLENERSLYLDLVNTQPAGIYRIRVFAKENWGEDAWKKADNPPFKMELISDRFCEILDINPQSLELHPGIIIDLVHPADKEEFIRRNDEANTLVSNFKWDCRIVIKDKIKWIHFESLPRKLENGDILFTGIIYDITEQKIAQEKLQDSEMRFRKILQDVESLSVQGYAPDGTTQYWNKASERLYGYTAEEAIGKNFTDLIIPSEMREGVKQIIKQMAETGQAIPASELSLLRKDGSLVTVFSNHTIVQIAGQPQELFCIDIDLTELKKAEEALKKNQKMLADTETIGKVGGWEFNMDTFEQIWTEETYEIHELHYDFEATVENGINFYTPESLPIIQNAVNLAVEKGEPFDLELEIITAKGNRKFVHTIGKTDMEGRRVYGFFQDITERKNAEQALKESEEKLSTLFSSMTEMVVMHELVLDENGEAVNYIIIDCNKAFTDITGIKKKEAVGMLATKLYASTTAPYLKEYATVCATGKPLEFNTYFAPMEKHFLISVVFIGKNRFSTISTDITSNEQIHAIIKEKNKELENYIYVASHDLRSPLVNIQGFSQRLQKQTSQLTKVISEINLNTELASEFSKITTVEIPKSLDFILNNVSKMDTLINGLLQLSRTGQIKINVNNVNMNNLFRKIIAAFNFQLSEYGAEVKIHKIIDCYGDENQLNQLFSNIISNAIKYRDKNRKLTIEISSIILYNKVIYNIKDTGIGMNQRHLERIWDVFYRVDASAAEAGEGLGLSLAKRIVDKHKGKIWAESVEGVGSTFFVELHRNNFEV